MIPPTIKKLNQMDRVQNLWHLCSNKHKPNYWVIDFVMTTILA